MRTLFRTDASVALGTGHAMRCLALAQALAKGDDEAFFACAKVPEAIHDQLDREGFRLFTLHSEMGTVEDSEETLLLCHQLGAQALVLDGRQFGLDYQKRVKSPDTCLVLVDDDSFPKGSRLDILINPNLEAPEDTYLDCPIEKLLLGRRYALLRKEFWPEVAKSASLRTRRVLVTMGGADPDNVAGKVVRALKKSTVEHLEIRVVVGPANPYLETLRHQAGRAGHPVEVLFQVPTMREQYEWADVAVSACGNTCLELARMGVAAIYLTIVENQEQVARSIRKLGFGKVLGWHEDVSEEQIRSAVRELLRSSEERDRMSQWGRELVDGQGALRAADALREFCV